MIRHNRLLVAFHVVSDALLGVSAFVIAYAIRFYAGLIPITRGLPPFQQYVNIVPFVAVLVPLGFHLQGLYRLRRGRSRVDDFFAVFVGTILAVVFGIVATTYVQTYLASAAQKNSGAFAVSQAAWAIFLVVNVGLTYSSRELMREVLERRWRAGIGLKRILIAGAGELGRLVADKIIDHRELGYQIVGFVDDRAGGDHLGYRGLPLLGTIDEAAEITARESIDHLYVALPPEQHLRMLELLDSTTREMVDVKVVPDLLQVIALRARLEDLDGVPVININDVPLQGFNAAVKRTIDIAISSGALLVVAIPLAIQDDVARSRLLPPGPHGPRRQIILHRQVPFDVRRCGTRNGAGMDGPGRSSGDAARPFPAPIQPRRAAPAVERAPRRHVDRGSAARAPAFRRAVQAQDPAVHAPPQGEGGTDRVGAGQRLARKYPAREADRVRPVLHRELVGPSRSEDHVAYAHPGLLPQARVLTFDGQPLF